MKNRKLLGAGVSLAMLASLGFVPAAFAADPEGCNAVTTADKLAECLSVDVNNATTGGPNQEARAVKLNADITVSTSATVSGGTVALDLNGHKISNINNRAGQTDYKIDTLTVASGAGLTISDSSADGTGAIVNGNYYGENGVASADAYVALNNKGTTTVRSGSIVKNAEDSAVTGATADKPKATSNSYAAVSNTGRLTFNGGAVRHANGTNTYTTADLVSNTGTLTIAGGTFTGTIDNSNTGAVNISGGTFGVDNAAQRPVKVTNGDVNISGGTFTADVLVSDDTATPGKVNISGGTFTAVKNLAKTAAPLATVTISQPATNGAAATFSADSKNNVLAVLAAHAGEAGVVRNENGTFTVVKPAEDIAVTPKTGTLQRNESGVATQQLAVNETNGNEYVKWTVTKNGASSNDITVNDTTYVATANLTYTYTYKEATKEQVEAAGQRNPTVFVATNPTTDGSGKYTAVATPVWDGTTKFYLLTGKNGKLIETSRTANPAPHGQYTITGTLSSGNAYASVNFGLNATAATSIAIPATVDVDLNPATGEAPSKKLTVTYTPEFTSSDNRAAYYTTDDNRIINLVDKDGNDVVSNGSGLVSGDVYVKAGSSAKRGDSATVTVRSQNGTTVTTTVRVVAPADSVAVYNGKDDEGNDKVATDFNAWIGDTPVQLTTKVLSEDKTVAATDQSVVWYVKDVVDPNDPTKTVANDVVSVTSDGKVTANKVGEAEIVAAAASTKTTRNGKTVYTVESDPIKVTVLASATKLIVDQSSVAISIPQNGTATAHITSTVLPTGATLQTLDVTTSEDSKKDDDKIITTAKTSSGDLVVTAKKAGRATVTLTSRAKDNSGKTFSREVPVTVTEVGTPVTGVTFAEPATADKPETAVSSETLTLTQTKQVLAKVVPADATNKNLTVASSNEQIATVTAGEPDDNGNVLLTITAVGVNDTAAYINVTASNGATYRLPITVQADDIAYDIDVTPNNTDSTKPYVLNGTSSVKINTTIRPSTALQTAKYAITSVTLDGTTYTGDDLTAARKAAVVKLADDGTVTGVAPGTVAIKVTADGKSNGTAVTEKTIYIQVKAVAVDSLSFESNNVNLTLGTEQATTKLTPVFKPANPTDKTVNYISNNTDVATVAADGTVTAVAEGTATITASSSNGKMAQVIVTVAPAPVPVSELTVDPTELSLTTGSTATITATVDEAATDKTVTFTSSDETVATVDDKGVVTAVKAGAATITATAGEKTAEVTVTVADPIAVESVSVSPAVATVEVGKTVALVTTVTPDNATNKALTFSSADESVATVAADGTITGVAQGVTAILVTSANGKTAQAVVNVTAATEPTTEPTNTPTPTEEPTTEPTNTPTQEPEPTPTTTPATSVAVTPRTLTLNVGDTAKVTATVSPANSTDTVTFESSDESVATVSADGTVTAVAAGKATVTARAGRRSARVTVTVSEPEPTPAPVETTDIYRLYNESTGEHLFVSTTAERDALTAVGWKDEGTAWKAPTSGKRIYRLYNPNVAGGDHHYTTDENEKNTLVAEGWSLDDTLLYANESNEGTPVYRVYNPNQTAWNHHFTTNATEYNSLKDLGWSDEGVAFYVD